MPDAPTPGQLAYEAYCTRLYTHRAFLREAQSWFAWEMLAGTDRAAWEAAAEAVLDAWQAQPRRIFDGWCLNNTIRENSWGLGPSGRRGKEVGP